MTPDEKGSPVDLSSEWQAMRRRIVSLIESGELSDYGEEVMELDPSVYTDLERFEAERREIFREQPLLVALSGELSKPGDRLLFDAAGPSILVVRGEDGILRAFLNMCTHRGARLVSTCDDRKRLMCPFHGWVFDLEGKLKSVPLSQAFEGLDRETRGLVRVPVAERHGMVFVRARPGNDPLDLDDHLGTIGTLLKALDLGSLRCVQVDRLEARCNWKLALDMGRENYHVPVVHRESLARNLYPHVTIFDCYGPHSRFAGAGRDFADFIKKPESEWPDMNYQAVHYLFPNTTLSFTHSLDGETPVVFMSRVFPGASIGEAVTLLATYQLGRGQAGGAVDAQTRAMHDAVVGIVEGEDYAIAEAVWKSLEHGVPDMRFVLGRNELLVQRYHREIADRIAMSIPGAS